MVDSFRCPKCNAVYVFISEDGKCPNCKESVATIPFEENVLGKNVFTKWMAISDDFESGLEKVKRGKPEHITLTKKGKIQKIFCTPYVKPAYYETIIEPSGFVLINSCDGDVEELEVGWMAFLKQKYDEIYIEALKSGVESELAGENENAVIQYHLAAELLVNQMVSQKLSGKGLTEEQTRLIEENFDIFKKLNDWLPALTGKIIKKEIVDEFRKLNYQRNQAVHKRVKIPDDKIKNALTRTVNLIKEIKSLC